jgi:prepilin-type N-terminal cleavage/methylation domain-containing protein
MKTRAQKGFTLAELLIALAILGVIATFTIPKILTSTGTAQFKAIGKEASSIISGAMQDYMVNYAVSTSTRPDETATGILQSLNFVSKVTGATHTAALTGLPENCVTGTNTCYQLHNGAILQIEDDDRFAGTGTTNYLKMNLDPDGLKSTSATDILTFHIYTNAKILTNKDSPTGTDSATPLTGQSVATDPTWFSWVN